MTSGECFCGTRPNVLRAPKGEGSAKKVCDAHRAGCGAMSTTELVEFGRNVLSVATTCRLLGIPRSSYYERRSRKQSQSSMADAALAVHVRCVHESRRKRYGSPRIVATLRREGIRVGKNRVARLMREQSLIARRKRRFRITTMSDHSLPIARNLLAQDFSASSPNQVWVGDIT